MSIAITSYLCYDTIFETDDITSTKKKRWVTLCFRVSSYAAPPTLPVAEFVHVITSEQLSRISFILAAFLVLTDRLPGYILVDVCRHIDLELSWSNVEFLISLPKWPDCLETKSKHIDWTLGSKRDLGHDLDLDLQGQKPNLCLSQNGRIATKPKANISIELPASNITTGFDLGQDIDLGFPRSNFQMYLRNGRTEWCEMKTK